MIHLKNTVIGGQHQKPILLDVCYFNNSIPKPIVIFCHGYKGFKDWGAWNLMAEPVSKCHIIFSFMKISLQMKNVLQSNARHHI
jgi:hypothetical protein